MNELIIKKCQHCGALIKVIGNCDDKYEIKCCGEEMKTLVPNSVDAAIEKHIPTYEVQEGKIIVKVNHVMEDEHYIEWITMVNGNKEKTIYFKPGEEATARFCYHKGKTL